MKKIKGVYKNEKQKEEINEKYKKKENIKKGGRKKREREETR